MHLARQFAALAWGSRITHGSEEGIFASNAAVLDLYNFLSANATQVGGTGMYAVSSSLRGEETRMTSGPVGYEDRANDVFNLVLGAAGWRTVVEMAGGNRLAFQRGLPAAIAALGGKTGGKH